MNLLTMLKKGGLSQSATAIPATFATAGHYLPSKVAKVATVAVANPPKQAANDPAGSEPDALVELKKPEITAPEPPLDPNAWRELAAAYHQHHFACPTCITAGRGAQYGLRCGVGAALWTSYENT